MAEHFHGMEGVRGSIPLSSTEKLLQSILTSYRKIVGVDFGV